MNTRRVTLLVAAILAIGTGVLTLRYLTSLQAPPPPVTAEPKPILIAAVDIPARAKITPDMLQRTMKAADQIEPGAISDARTLEGTIALISIPKDSTITETKVGRPAQVGLTLRLKPGLRAITIPVDRVKAISGLIEPGDHVDVIAIPPRTGVRPPQPATIIRGAEVYAINSQLESAGSTPNPDAGNPVTVTLGVTPEQADLLSMADLNSTLRLALRSPQEALRSLPPEQLVFPTPVPPATPRPAPIVAAPKVGPFIPINPVTVIEGDKVANGSGNGR